MPIPQEITLLITGYLSAIKKGRETCSLPQPNLKNSNSEKKNLIKLQI